MLSSRKHRRLLRHGFDRRWRTGLFALLTAAAAPCFADEAPAWFVQLGGVSHHFRRDGQHEDVNPGLGLQYRFTPAWGVIAGGYLNSDHHISEYAFGRWQPLSLGAVRLGAIGGLVNHYDHDNGRVRGALLFAASVDLWRVNVSLVGMPSAGNIDGCVSLQFGFRL